MAQMEFDPKWVRAAQNGDQSAMAALYQYSYRQVYLTIKSMIRSDEDTVMDLLQDAFLKSIDNLHKLGDPSKYNAWIKVIARNTTLDYLKKKKPDLFSSYSDEDGTDTFLDPADPDTDHMPDIAMDDQETKRMLQEIMEALPERQKVTVSMYYYLEMSIKDIARTLGIPEATVKTRLHNGRETIKNKILDIEKRDKIRLHGIAPITFFLFLFHKVDAMAMEPDKNILANILNASASSASSGTASSPTGKGTAAGVKSAGGAATKGIAAKVVTGIATVAVISGGAFYGITHLNRNDEPDSAPTSSTENTESQDIEDEPAEPVYATAMEAYRDLLQAMENDSNTLLQCSHLVDLNKDGTDELIVLSDDSRFQLYTFKDGQASLLSEQEMASVFTEYWEYGGITAKEYKEQNGFDAPLQVYLTDDNSVIWVETTIQGDAGSEHNYVRITYDGTEASQDDYWEQGGIYQINDQQVDAAEYQTAFTDPFHDGRTLTDDTDRILGIEDTEESNETTDSADYSSIIDDYAGFFSGNITKEDFTLTQTCQEVAPEFTPWPVFASQKGQPFYQPYDVTAAYKYAYYDIDQDGNEELLVIETAESQITLLDVWGMSEGKPILLWTFDSMTYGTLCTGPYLKMTNRGDSWYWAIDYSGWRQDIEFNEVLPADTQYDVPFTELDMQDIGEN